MAVKLSDNIFINANKSQDAKYGPWSSLADAVSNIPIAYRHLGLTVGLIENGQIVEYWWKESTDDVKLVIKQATVTSPPPAAPEGIFFTQAPGLPKFTSTYIEETDCEISVNGVLHAIPSATLTFGITSQGYKRTDAIAIDCANFVYVLIEGNDDIPIDETSISPVIPANHLLVRYIDIVNGVPVPQTNGIKGITVNGGGTIYVPDKDTNILNIESPTGHGIVDSSNVLYPTRSKLKFTGATITDDSVNSTTLVAINAGTTISSTDDITSEGTTNKWWTNARTISSVLTGYAKAVSSVAISATHTILEALQILEKKIDDNTTNKLDKILTMQYYSASHVLVLGNIGGFIQLDSTTAITLTVPPNSSVAFPVGTQIVCVQMGGGQVTVIPGSGVTVNSEGGKYKGVSQYSGFTLVKSATDTWFLFGGLTA